MSVTRYNKKLKIHEMRTIKELEELQISKPKIPSKIKMIDMDDTKIEKLVVPIGLETQIELNKVDKVDKVDFSKERRNALIMSDTEIKEIIDYIKKIEII